MSEIPLSPRFAIDESRDGTLDCELTSLTIRQVSPRVRLTALRSLFLVSPETAVDLTDLFAIDSEGALQAVSVEPLRARLLAAPDLFVELGIEVEGTEGEVFAGRVRAYLNRFRVAGALVAPPSCADLPVQGISLSAGLLGSDLVLGAFSDHEGRFDLSRVPRGVLSLRCEKEHQGRWYYGQGLVIVDGDLEISVSLRSAVDIAAGVPPLFRQAG